MSKIQNALNNHQYFSERIMLDYKEHELCITTKVNTGTVIDSQFAFLIDPVQKKVQHAIFIALGMVQKIDYSQSTNEASVQINIAGTDDSTENVTISYSLSTSASVEDKELFKNTINPVDKDIPEYNMGFVTVLNELKEIVENNL